MRGGGKHAFKRRKLLRNECGHFLEAWSADKDQQVVTAGHEVTGFNFFKPADAVCETVEPTATFGRDAHFDHSTDDAGVFLGQIEHRPPSEQDAVFL